MPSLLRPSAGLCAVATALALAACGGASSSRLPARDTYIKWVAFEVPINDMVLLRWRHREMPLRVHLPEPPAGLFDDPHAIQEAVREGVLGWSDVAEPGIPSFVFVDEPADADIPVRWAAEPDGSWYIAHCAYDIRAQARRFGVAQILVTGRWSPDKVATSAEIRQTLMHEMGHALGLGGHSPDPGDVMYPSVSGQVGEGLSARDRATLSLLYSRPVGARVVGARHN